MTDIRTSQFGGIPFGDNSKRPVPATGQPYFNGEEKRLELYTSSGWQNIVSETPGVVSVAGSYLESIGSATLEITGTNFSTGAIASAIGTNGIEINANSTTVNSIVSISATFSGLSAANEPYDIKITNTSNLFGLLPDALYINQSPVWQTASGSLGTFNEQVSITLSALSATDPESSPVTYALANGSSLPSGVTLNSTTGVISGTLPDVSTDTTYTFTINASDGLNIIPRTFSITALYLFPVEYLVVGGGGASGVQRRGGGGAGGMLTGTRNVQRGSQLLLTVGNGGAANNSSQTFSTAENSVFSDLIAYGGGCGAADNGGSEAANGRPGGSGGGGLGDNAPYGVGGTGTPGQGNNGGSGQGSTGPYYGAGGGGGAGAVGGNGNSNGVAGNGGDGLQSSITGTATYYAGGGGGGYYNNTAGQRSSGGLGGGGRGASNTTDAESGAPNTGGGGGGGYNGGPGNRNGGAGGSGIIVIAYPNIYPALSSIPGGLTYDQPTRSGYRVYRFTGGSGTVTV